MIRYEVRTAKETFATFPSADDAKVFARAKSKERSDWTFYVVKIETSERGLATFFRGVGL